MYHAPSEHASPSDAFANATAKAAPWWIGLGVIGVAVAIMAGPAPLLASLTLIGIGSDADLARRLREAIASEDDAFGESLRRAADPALVGGFVRRVHAAMYVLLVVFAWASLLHLAGGAGAVSTDRWWLAGDLAASAVLALGYARLARRFG
ncbi:MAG: hypothetical protein AAF266_09395 [Planctomycetota bacterium]